MPVPRDGIYCGNVPTHVCFQLLWRSGLQCLWPLGQHILHSAPQVGPWDHRSWQDSWSTTSAGCMVGPPAEGWSIPCLRTSQECIILTGIKVSSSEQQWPNVIALFPVFLEYRQRRKFAVLWHAVALSAKWELLERCKSVALNEDDISAFPAEGSVCVFLFAPVRKKAFGVLNPNLFTLLFLLYSWYSWIKYVQLFRFWVF